MTIPLQVVLNAPVLRVVAKISATSRLDLQRHGSRLLEIGLPEDTRRFETMPPRRSTKAEIDAPTSRPCKRARTSVDPSESEQVTRLDSIYKLPFFQAHVYYVPNFVEPTLARKWYDELLLIPGWYQPTLKMYGKSITQSRKICAYATSPALTVKYSGATVDMQYDYPPILSKIQKMVEQELGASFNHCMLNLYEDGKVYIGNHRDNKENRVIASVSLGAKRTFIMTHAPPAFSSRGGSRTSPAESKSGEISAVIPHDSDPETDDSELLRSKRWKLHHGSLVVMQGQTQTYWKHEIPKEPKIKEGRISLTFRQLVF
ncbi:BQ2448_5852 [Microbotryum intermedium]|uniref:BQ2448_5852 protein n=1 Tax=Microbotryum intermedium TaxID=269621 RepID=A0A238F7Z8_9BASI|nr:BQ2448_5852 [Microbotryum intermedium]